MSKRYTESDKWKDPWFRKLSPTAKLLLLYLYDQCDIAGFWGIDTELAAFHLGCPQSDIVSALNSLQRSYEINGANLWIKRFIGFQQSSYPLNPKNNAHLGIIRLLEAKSGFSENVDRVLNGEGLGSPYEGAGEPLFGLGASEPLPRGPSNVTYCKGNGSGKGLELPNVTSETKPYITKKGRKLSGDKLAWFEDFWIKFDYKQGKAAAADSWLDIEGLDSALAGKIIFAAAKEAHRRATLRPDQTAKMAQGWLTDRRWEDDYTETPSGNTSSRNQRLSTPEDLKDLKDFRRES